MTTSQGTVVQLNKTAPRSFRIIPAGAFSASDGRANGNWFLSEQTGRMMVALAAQRKDDFVIDYEHQTLYARANNSPAPAAGWFKQLEWRTDGLYVMDARWTATASAMVEAAEYRFISPVFNFNKETGMVNALHSIALTNTPALHGLTDLSLAAASAQFGNSDSQMTPDELEKYRWVFGGTPDELAAANARREQKPDVPGLEGMTEKDKETWLHTFGHLFK